MNNSRRFARLHRIFSKRNITIAGIATLALIMVFVAVTAYYYFTTPSNAILVTTAEFPKGLPADFTRDHLTDHIVADLQKIVEVADSSEVKDILAQQEGLGPRPARETFVPIRALSNAPSPVFNEEWKGVSFNFFRALGMSLRAKRFLELGVIGVPQGGWRLTASLKERPHFLARFTGSAPQGGGACSDFEKCGDDLTEQILRSLDYQRLLNFYIKTNTKDANLRILDLYQTTIPLASLKVDDLVAWGNAFSGLGQYDQALRKYQDALEKDSRFCPAQVARAFLYYRRPHGTQVLADLRLAEQDFRMAIVCDPTNKFTRTSLCHTLLQVWTNSPHPEAHLLVEAKENCEKALEIDPQFVVAAVNKGYLLYQQGNREEALHYFESLSQRSPTHSALFLNYGFLLYLEYLRDNGEDTLQQATAQTLQAWRLNQNSDVAADNLGFFYYEQGNYEKAVEFWNQASTLDPSDPDSIAGLALAAYKRGDAEAAKRLLSRAIQMDRNYADPAYLKKNNNWSQRAAADLAELISLSHTG